MIARPRLSLNPQPGARDPSLPVLFGPAAAPCYNQRQIWQKVRAMQLLWHIIKKSVTDLWDEMLLLVLFNLIWVIGAALLIPLPLVTFGLVFIAHDVAAGRGIKFGQFWGYARRYWKAAYIWGIFNGVVLGVFWFNVVFYGGLTAAWAALAQAVFLALTTLWLVWQLVVVTLYPRLVEPRFKLAGRNAVILIGKNPVIVLLVMLVIALLLAATAFAPALGLGVTVSLLVLLLTNTVDLLLKKELLPPEDKL